MDSRRLRASAFGSAVAAVLAMFASPSHEAPPSPKPLPTKPLPPVTWSGAVTRKVVQAPTPAVRDAQRRFGRFTSSPSINWDFEGDASGWTGDFGRACGPVTATRAGKPNAVMLGGDYWKNSFSVGQSGHCRLDSSGRRGTSTSPEITLGPADLWLAFRVGGGGASATVSLQVKTQTTWANAPGVSVEHGPGQIGMARIVWSLAGLDGKTVRVVVTDGGSALGFLVDDFQSTRFAPQAHPPAVWGMADLHAHFFNHMGFGGKMMAGTPHSAIDRYGHSDGSTSQMSKALSTQQCHDVHGTAPNVPFGVSTNDGVVTLLPEGAHDASGYPNFRGWPNFRGTVHQQAYVDWIKRAVHGGLRLVQVDVGNHGPLGKLVEAMTAALPLAGYTAPFAGNARDDASNIDLQLNAMHSFATLPDVSPWAEIARTPADARRIVGAGKLAMVLGVEVEDLGNLSALAAGWTTAQLQTSIASLGPTAPPRTWSSAQINSATKTYLQSLYARDVRHIIPIHTSDNVFGAAAVYDFRMAAANRMMTGHWFPERNAWTDGIRARSDASIPRGNLPGFADKIARLFFHQQYQTILDERTALLQTYANAQPGGPPGYAHQFGLTDVGRAAIQMMMQMGIVVDMDHMSDLAIDETIDIAQRFDYPVIFSHTGFRDLSFGRWKKSADPANASSLPRYDTPNNDTSWDGTDAVNTLLGTDDAELLANERSHSEAQVMAVAALGGMVGVGTGGGVVPVTYPQSGAHTPNHCDGSTTTFAQGWSYAVDKMGGRGVAIGTDINGLNGMSGPRFGPNACAAAFSDKVRGPFTNRQVMNQRNPVKYSGGVLNFTQSRFTGPSIGTLAGMMGASEHGRPYTDQEETVWQAIALFKAGQDHNRPGKNYLNTRENRAHRLAWGFYQATINAMRPSGCDAFGYRNCDPANPFDTFADARAAYDVAKNARQTDFDDHGAYEDVVQRIWNKWKDMEAGSNAPLVKSSVGTAGAGSDWDINLDGFAHYGLMPDFIQDAKNNGLTDADLAPLFSSAEDYIEMWEKIERRKSQIPSPP